MDATKSVTKSVNKYQVSEDVFYEVVEGKVKPYINGISGNITKILDEIGELFSSNRYLSLIYNGECYYELYTVAKLIIPRADGFKGISDFIDKLKTTVELDVNNNKKNNKQKHTQVNKKLFGHLPLELPTMTQLYNIDYRVICKCICDDKETRNKYGEIIDYLGYYGEIREENESEGEILVANLSFKDTREFFVKYCIPCGFGIKGLSDGMNEFLSKLSVLCNCIPGFVFLDDDGSVKINYGRDVLKKMIDESNKKLKSLQLELVDILRDYHNSKKIKVSDTNIKEKLLNCEKERADIEPYDEKILSDPNRGHWDLWNEKDNSNNTLEFSDELVARNPICDINENGVIAIDFGTKSTIVVYQSDIDHSLPMGIGDGNLSKGPTNKRFENPTVMHFVDLDVFLEAYNSSKGRPSTKWNDLTISHTAMDQFDNSKSSDYYEYLHQIKQWAGQREKQFRVKSHDGETYLLPSFLDLKDDDWNPVEIYAYYIGLYINNMRNGIYLDYYLSFPVTYETQIRKKIIKSFEKGLKKSFPTIIVQNDEIMKKFHVHGDISEPAAYAVCALQEYGFEPDENEEVFYGIFDFGGGTTDFDFGLWSQSKKNRYDYTIEDFGGNGDEFLGGENLLEIIAFEVFKSNAKLMREKGYTFTLAPKCVEFAGSDILLADSQEAEKNMHNLMEKIRPYWEGTIKESDEKDDKIEFKLMLFNKDGEDCPGETLTYSKKKINELIEKRIEEGVNNFFSDLLLSYQNDKVNKSSAQKINIFLAGNSCKSPVVKKVFGEKISEHERNIKEKYKIKDEERLFEIFPPLGTEEAYKKMEERNLEFSKDDFEKPTGKTGVAFGLIQCREGGSIERISSVGNEEIPFQFFIGWGKRKKFVPFKDDSKTTKYLGKPDYNEWYKFIEADIKMFELYYTTLPECINGDLTINNAAVKRLRCDIEKVDEDAFVFVRAVDPHTIEYAVSKDYNVDEKKIGGIIRRELNYES